MTTDPAPRSSAEPALLEVRAGEPERWREGDAEAIRQALAIPITPAALWAIEEEMAGLERHYPAGIAVAIRHLDAIALLDQQALGSGAEPPLAVEPVVRKVTRKGAAGPVSDPLPKKKLDVIEYATELLLEEVSTEYALPPAPEPVALPPAQQRSRHLRALLLIFPRLQVWRVDGGNPFEGALRRG